jgi:hypothetical protein
MDELYGICETQKAPETLVNNILAALEQQPPVLFCWVDVAWPLPKENPLACGYYASDKLVRLLEAARALDWESAIAALEQPETANV